MALSTIPFPAELRAANDLEGRGPSKLEILPLLSATLEEIADGLDQKAFTSTQLVQAYKARIKEVNGVFRSVIELNPEAEATATALDVERRKQGRRRQILMVRSVLHGIPFLLKDNIFTLDDTETTCGSTVLRGSKLGSEASVVKLLRDAGAVILGKANLSEFVGFRYTNASTGWSARGGQASGIFWPGMKPSGSSTGSAISVGLGLVSASFGTETTSSIVSPSEKSGVVGYKPSRGMIAVQGIITASAEKDIVGPITRTVKDAALILDAITPARHGAAQIADSCSTADLHGVRIGIVRDPTQTVDKAKLDAFQITVDLLKAAGAVIVDDVRLAGLDEYISLPDGMKQIVLDTEFKVSMEIHLQSLIINPRHLENLEDLIEAIKHDRDEDYPSRNVAIMQRALSTNVNASNYREMLEKQLYFADNGGLEGAMRERNCTALITPAGSLLIQSFAAMGGNPVISVPMGFYPEGTKLKHDPQSGFVTVAPGIPFSLYQYGKRFDDQSLFRVAYAFEQLTQARMKSKPYLVPKLDLKDFIEPPRLRANL
ncbi:amidase signature domain-containing protein [Leptodontidium sp. MPI-SDFR-AT-0119]|nr:amidase signature domain-containing protein [Leptodontidium sp. MPI-SDFR-AT-0119]